MAFDEGNAAVADLSCNAKNRPNAKSKRYRAKRDGPPQLQFLTATNPSQFKDENLKKSVRSQAMIHSRHVKAALKKKDQFSSTTDTATVSEIGATRNLKYGQTNGYSPCPSSDSQSDDIWEHKGLTTKPNAGDLHPTAALAHGCRGTEERKVIRYEATENHERFVERLLVGKFIRYYQIGDGVDPFVAFPQFQHAELNSLLLIRRCMRDFASEMTMKKQAPVMVRHPHVLLSSVVLASTWVDMHAGFSGDSVRTSMVKAETISMINERLQKPETRLKDSTLMIILHLLAGEMWNCNEKTLRTHELGVARFITQRGGMQRFESNTIGEIAAACSYNCNIICEANQLPVFRDWEPPKLCLADEDIRLPESPLFCPRRAFVTVSKDTECSVYTHGILRDMRDLTDLFIAKHEASPIVKDFDSVNATCSSSPSLEFDRKAAEIHRRLVSLPSADIPNLPTHRDWVFEACRMTALVYTAAIILRIPFSIAADPSRYLLLSDAVSNARSSEEESLLSAPFTATLYEVIGHTNIADIWNDMAGVLYWICSVGAAAARMPATLNMTSQTRFRREASAVWVRRSLIMTATRTMIILIFQHPIPMLSAQKRFLKVQELIRASKTS